MGACFFTGSSVISIPTSICLRNNSVQRFSDSFLGKSSRYFLAISRWVFDFIYSKPIRRDTRARLYLVLGPALFASSKRRFPKTLQHGSSTLDSFITSDQRAHKSLFFKVFSISFSVLPVDKKRFFYSSAEILYLYIDSIFIFLNFIFFNNYYKHLILMNK